MRCKKTWVLAALVLFASTALSQQLTYKGNVQIELNQAIFQAGEELHAEITLFNHEDFPIADAYAIVEIVKGSEFYYPSQMADTDNVFFEEKISNIGIAPKSSKKIQFSYKFPEDLSYGSYRLDVYFKNERAGIVGYAHIFLNPKSAFIAYFGEGSFPEAKIVRSKTVFNDQAGPVGFPAEANSAIEGTVFVENVSGTALNDLELTLLVCDWDDTDSACAESGERKEVAVGALAAGEEKAAAVQLNAPEKPGAYAIRMELRQGNRLLSLYRNRIIVTGATKRIHKIYLNKSYFRKGETVEINALVGPSPDHFNNPVLEGSRLVLSVKDTESGSELFRQAVDLPGSEPLFAEKKAGFTAESELKKIEVCGEVEKEGTVYDRYCFTVDAALFEETQKAEISTDWDYEQATEKLRINFCALSPNSFAQPMKMLYYLQQNGQTIGSEEIESEACIEKQFVVPVGTYELIINNLETGRQRKEAIDLAAYLQSCANLNCDDGNPCTSDGCSRGQCVHEALADGTSCGSNGSCANGECVETGIIQHLPLAILLIAIIIIILWGYKHYARRGEQ